MDNFNLDDKFKKLQNFDGNIRKEQIEKNTDKTNKNALGKIFDIFDKNKDGILDSEELNGIFSSIQKADTNQNSIFEVNEAEDFLNITSNQERNPAKQDIKSSELTNFLNILTTSQYSDDLLQSYYQKLSKGELNEYVSKIKSSQISKEEITDMSPIIFLILFDTNEDLAKTLNSDENLKKVVFDKLQSIITANECEGMEYSKDTDDFQKNIKGAIKSIFVDKKEELQKIKPKLVWTKSKYANLVDADYYRKEGSKALTTNNIIEYFSNDNKFSKENDNRLKLVAGENPEEIKVVISLLLEKAKENLDEKKYNVLSATLSNLINSYEKEEKREEKQKILSVLNELCTNTSDEIAFKGKKEYPTNPDNITRLFSPEGRQVSYKTTDTNNSTEINEEEMLETANEIFIRKANKFMNRDEFEAFKNNLSNLKSKDFAAKINDMFNLAKESLLISDNSSPLQNYIIRDENGNIFTDFYREEGIDAISENNLVEFFKEENELSDKSIDKLELLTGNDADCTKYVFDKLLIRAAKSLPKTEYEKLSDRIFNIVNLEEKDGLEGKDGNKGKDVSAEIDFDSLRTKYSTKTMTALKTALSDGIKQIQTSNEDIGVTLSEQPIVKTIDKNINGYYYHSHPEELNENNIIEFFNPENKIEPERANRLSFLFAKKYNEELKTPVSDEVREKIKNLADMFLEKMKTLKNITPEEMKDIEEQISYALTHTTSTILGQTAASKTAPNRLQLAICDPINTLNTYFGIISQKIKQSEQIEQIREKNPEAGEIIDYALKLLNMNKSTFIQFQNNKGLFDKMSEFIYSLYGISIEDFGKIHITKQEENFNQMINILAKNPEKIKEAFETYFIKSYDEKAVREAFEAHAKFQRACYTPTNIKNPDENLQRTQIGEINGAYYRNSIDKINEDNVLEYFFSGNMFSLGNNKNRLDILTGGKKENIEKVTNILLKRLAKEKEKNPDFTEKHYNAIKEAIEKRLKDYQREPKYQTISEFDPITGGIKYRQIAIQSGSTEKEDKALLEELNFIFKEASSQIYTGSEQKAAAEKMNNAFYGLHTDTALFIQGFATDQAEVSARFKGAARYLLITAASTAIPGSGGIVLGLLKAGLIASGATLSVNYLDRAASKNGIEGMSKEQHIALLKQALYDGIMATVTQLVSAGGDIAGIKAAQKLGLSEKAVNELTKLAEQAKEGKISQATVKAYLVKEVVSIISQAGTDVVIDQILGENADKSLIEAFKNAVLQEFMSELIGISRDIKGQEGKSLFNDALTFAQTMKIPPGIVKDKNNKPTCIINVDKNNNYSIEEIKIADSKDTINQPLRKDVWYNFSYGNPKNNPETQDCVINSVLKSLPAEQKQNILMKLSADDKGIDVIINGKQIFVPFRMISNFNPAETNFSTKTSQDILVAAVREATGMPKNQQLSAVEVAKVFGYENPVNFKLEQKNISEQGEILKQLLEKGSVLTLIGSNEEIAKVIGKTSTDKTNHALQIRSIVKNINGDYFVEFVDLNNPSQKISRPLRDFKGFTVSGATNALQIQVNGKKIKVNDDSRINSAPKTQAGGGASTEITKEELLANINTASTPETEDKLNKLKEIVNKIDDTDTNKNIKLSICQKALEDNIDASDLKIIFDIFDKNDSKKIKLCQEIGATYPKQLIEILKDTQLCSKISNAKEQALCAFAVKYELTLDNTKDFFNKYYNKLKNSLNSNYTDIKAELCIKAYKDGVSIDRIQDILKKYNTLASKNTSDADKILTQMLQSANLSNKPENSKFNQNVPAWNENTYLDDNFVRSEITSQTEGRITQSGEPTHPYRHNYFISNPTNPSRPIINPTYVDSLNIFIRKNRNILGRFTKHGLMRFLDRTDCINSDGSINEAKAEFLIDYIYSAIEKQGKCYQTIGGQKLIAIPNPFNSDTCFRIGIDWKENNGKYEISPNDIIQTFIHDYRITAQGQPLTIITK